jgi:hypothetical protein
MTVTTDLAAILGLEDYLDAAPENTRKAAAYSMNDVIGGPAGLGVYRKAINAQANFPAGYLDDNKRFGMDQRATPDNLVASLVARQRPTSLARFVTSGGIGTKGVSVQVKRGGGSSRFRTGFLVRLKAGTSMDGGNIGLAVRLSPGTVLNKDVSKMVHLDANVVLLYGPSIDQILNNNVADSETPVVIDNVATEFYRQFARLQSDV